MTQKYTPASWFYEQTMTHIVDREIVGKSFTVFSSSNKKIGIAHIYTKDKNDTLLNDYRYEFDEAENNARLIAAAPELLEALEEIEERIDEKMGEWSSVAFDYLPENMETLYEIRQAARNALAKAKGEA